MACCAVAIRRCEADAGFHALLGKALAQQGRDEEALKELRAADALGTPDEEVRDKG